MPKIMESTTRDTARGAGARGSRRGSASCAVRFLASGSRRRTRPWRGAPAKCPTRATRLADRLCLLGRGFERPRERRGRDALQARPGVLDDEDPARLRLVGGAALALAAGWLSYSRFFVRHDLPMPPPLEAEALRRAAAPDALARTSPAARA